jgi:hypothetical protein
MQAMPTTQIQSNTTLAQAKVVFAFEALRVNMSNRATA